jgi:DNA-binding CsgD family transcriptional regulator
MGMRPIEEEGNIIGVQCIIHDITERKKTEEMLRDSEARLREQKISLEQKNSALKELLEQIELERKRVKEDIFINVDKLVVPFLKKLRKRSSSVDAKYIDAIEHHLEDLIVPFGRKITDKHIKLSPREVEICNMIKNGLSSKEISEFLNISLQTTERHRNNIREKMGLVNKDINLCTYLQAL